MRLHRNTTDLEHDEEPDGDYVLDDRTQTVSLTDSGIEKIEQQLEEIDTAAGQSVYDPQYYELVHYLDNALKARYIFKRDKDYIVQNGQVILIDQTTGRPMPSRRYSEGLHQAIEAKEGVQVKREDVTIATITVQNYFRLYDKLAGMTGTAVTQAEEFDEVYELDVVAIPTNVEFQAQNDEFETRKEKVGSVLPTLGAWDFDESVPVMTYYIPDDGGSPAFYQRVDFPDQVYQSIEGKFDAVSEEIRELNTIGRPVLVGTGSVEASEMLSKKLKKIGLDHEVLNAKNHQREALIVAQAGRAGSITISTSMAGRGTDILLGGNSEGLAASYLAERLFDAAAFGPLVANVVEGNLSAARQKAAAHPAMDEALVDWVATANDDLIRKANVEDVLGAVITDVRKDPAYRDIPYDTFVEILRNIELAGIDYSRLDKARSIAEQHGAPLSIIPDLQYRLNEYRSLSGLLGQQGQVETLTRLMFEQHYNARAALIRAVLANDLDEARRLTSDIPALPASLIDEIQKIRVDCQAEQDDVRQRGGLHVIGTERHELRRIDDQLRGRAARQGDPGSSRFYLSLEDELMLRFGGDRTKRIMERLNIPEDMPIQATILSNVIEQAQARFENFTFDMRKNLVEYDEAVNRQRQIVYDERTEILSGDGSELDSLVGRFMKQTLERVIVRLRDNYEDWAQSEIQTVVDDYTFFETNEVNTRGVVQRVLGLFPRPDPDAMQDLLAINDTEELHNALHEMILDGIEQGHNIRMLHGEVARIVPLWPVLPELGPHGIEGWEAFVSRAHEAFDRYTSYFEEPEQEQKWEETAAGLDRALRDYIATVSSGAKAFEVQSQFAAQLGEVLNPIVEDMLDELEQEDLLDVLQDRINDLLEIAHRQPEGDVDGGYAAERKLFAIGPEEVVRYERALMLSVIDGEWRQYLNAIDDLRQGVGLEAFGQRDPKIEFKRRAFEMFDTLRADVEEGIARRFFSEIPRHRQVIEDQQRLESLLDNLSQLGYRVERKVAVDSEGQVRVAQTVHKDLWSNVGRNDPCPCGSGKKFKDCHYRKIQQQQQTVAQGTVSRAGSGKKRGRRH